MELIAEQNLLISLIPKNSILRTKQYIAIAVAFSLNHLRSFFLIKSNHHWIVSARSCWADIKPYVQ